MIGVVAKRVTRFIPAVATPPAVVVPQRRLARVAASLMTFAVSAGTLLLGWVGYLKLFDINSFVGKGPGDVWRFLSEPMFSDSRHEVMSALNQTLVDAGIGLVMGWTVAIALACSFVLWPTVERTLMPLALALRSVPILAVLPALTLTFGRGLTGTVVIVMIIVFFPTLVIVLQALRSVPPDLVAVARAYNSSALTLLRKVRLPLALPAVFASLRIACPGALLGALLAEWLATGKGMGYLMLSATTLSEYTTLWAASVVLTSIAVIAYTVTDALERFVIVRFGAAPNA